MEPRVLPFERIRNAIVQRLVRVPAGWARRLVVAPDRDGSYELDFTMQLLLGVMRLTREGSFDAKPSLAEARRSYHVLVDALERPQPPSPMEVERLLTSPSGSRSVRVRVHDPAPGERRPALVYFHGGGYVVGDLDTHGAFARRLCRAAGVVVVAVDYRLAPEHPFPAAIDDCVAATRAVLAQADELGVDATRVAVAGDSAGANLAINVAQVVPGLCAQLLVYPTTDVGLETESKRRFAVGYGLDRTTVDWFVARYLGHRDHTDPRASPLRSESLAACPRTRVVLAGFDVLRDEGSLLAGKLEAVGVATKLRVEGSLTHGFVHLTRVPACDAAVARLACDVRELFQA